MQKMLQMEIIHLFLPKRRVILSCNWYFDRRILDSSHRKWVITKTINFLRGQQPWMSFNCDSPITEVDLYKRLIETAHSAGFSCRSIALLKEVCNYFWRVLTIIMALCNVKIKSIKTSHSVGFSCRAITLLKEVCNYLEQFVPSSWHCAKCTVQPTKML